MNLEQYLNEEKVWYRVIKKQETVHTADAASKTGLPLERITKSIVCLTDDEEPIMAIIPGNCKVNLKEVAKSLKKKKVMICPFEKAHKYSGYDPGTTPPVFYRKIKRVIVDKKLMEYETIYGGGGTRKKLLEMKPQHIVKLNNAIVSGISNEI